MRGLWCQNISLFCKKLLKKNIRAIGFFFFLKKNYGSGGALTWLKRVASKSVFGILLSSVALSDDASLTQKVKKTIFPILQKFKI